MSRVRLLSATTLTFILSTQAHALNLTGHQFTDSYRYSLLNDSLMEKFPGRYVGTLSVGSIHSPFFYSDTYLHDKRKDIIDSNQVLTAGFSYYVTDRIAVGVEANAIQNTVFDDTTTSLGDTLVHAKFNLLHKDDFSLSLNPRASLPTGREKNFTSQGSVGGALNVVAEKSFNKFHLLASVGGQSSKENRYADVDHRQLLLTQIGLSYDVSEKINVNLESWRNIPLVNDTLQDEGKYYLTAKYRATNNLSGYAGIGTSGLTNVSRETYSAFVGIKIHGAEETHSDSVAVAAAAPVRAIPTSEVYFGHDRSDLNSTEADKLGEYVDFFSTVRDVTSVEIGGFASAVGSRQYNQKLSEKRAETVRTILVDKGVSADLLTTKGYGEEFAQGPNIESDRRVQFKIIKKD